MAIDVQDLYECMRFEVPTTASIPIMVSWYVTQCSLVNKYQLFRGTFCPHRRGRLVRQKVPLKISDISIKLHGFTSKRTAILILYCDMYTHC
jgi:hypothetical protein